MKIVTYDRPVAGRLMVQLDSPGEPTFEAGDADLEKFGYVDPREVYRRFCAMLSKAIGDHGPYDGSGVDLTDIHLNQLRHLAEVALFYPHTDEEEMLDTYVEVGAIEKTLAAHEDEFAGNIRAAGSAPGTAVAVEC